MSDIPMDPIVEALSAMERESSGSENVSKTKSESGEYIGDNSATPLEDRFGRPLWVRTRMCFCPPSSPTDCRFHSPEEPGWEQCPHTESAKQDKNIKGLWLWARNPMYNKPLTEAEEKERLDSAAPEQKAA